MRYSGLLSGALALGLALMTTVPTGHARDAGEAAKSDAPLSHAEKISRMPPVATAAGLAGVYYVLDCTNEGAIGVGEASEHGGTLFRRMDLDRSRKLSREEYLAFVHESLASIRNAYFDEMDLDGDGLVHHIDYLKHLQKLILDADINKDGDASWKEILTLRGELDENATGKAATPGVANFQAIDVKAGSPQQD
ncbi:MAG: hypothetical protein ACFB6R_06895 [Alphaproteobacteria bacterium]